MKGKLIIVTAPSGAGKTTIVKHLLAKFENLAFSVSATTRECRAHEEHGKDYYFISVKDFKEEVANGAFLEWVEVYDNQYYGTLHSELERLWDLGKTIIFDIDVIGAQTIKQKYPNNSMAIFVQPPSEKELLERLENRKTESEDSLRKRIARAKKELTYFDKFDKVLVNDNLEKAFKDADKMINDFLKKPLV